MDTDPIQVLEKLREKFVPDSLLKLSNVDWLISEKMFFYYHFFFKT